MKVLKKEGKFEILSKTEDVIWQIANAARTCYKSNDKQSEENDLKLVKNLLTRGHYAMIEFADMTVKFDDVSRGFTHELVRHRLASFAQESTRYVNESDLHVIVPPHKDENERTIDNLDGLTLSLTNWFACNEQAYRDLLSAGYKPEDARQVLPTATKAPICIKANLREWRQIFTMRCDKFAHWEIRDVMLDLLKYCKENIPLIFDDFHFFKTESGQEYARPIVSEVNLKDIIEHYLKANTISVESEKETILEFIDRISNAIVNGRE